MIHIKTFAFNDFQENTYVLSDETKECVIIDPGCYTKAEKDQITDYINNNQLKPVHLLNTHCHLDHIFGNAYISKTYELLPTIHRKDLSFLQNASILGQNWGLEVEKSPEPGLFLEEGDVVRFGNSELKVLFLPGHSPGSIGFFCKKENFLIAGDVLFRESIGRTDLPGGDLSVLLDSIRKKLFILDDTLVVHPGHGPTTTILHEKQNNGFLLASFYNPN